MAGPRPDMVGKGPPVVVLTPHDKGVTPNIVWENHRQQGTALEMVLVPGTTERALLDGHPLQPLGESPLLAFPTGHVQEGLLWALAALFPVEGPVAGEPAGMPNQVGDLDVDLEVGADEDNAHLLSRPRPLPRPFATKPKPSSPPPPLRPDAGHPLDQALPAAPSRD